MSEVDGHISFGCIPATRVVTTRVNLQIPVMPIAQELWCFSIMILRGSEILEILQVELERLPSLSRGRTPDGHFGVLDLTHFRCIRSRLYLVCLVDVIVVQGRSGT